MNQSIHFKVNVIDAEACSELLEATRPKLVADLFAIQREIERNRRKARFWNNAAILALSIGLLASLSVLVLG